MEILWFIPTHGDSQYLGTTKGGRLTDISYFRQMTQAADHLGYTRRAHPYWKILRRSLDVTYSLTAIMKN